MTITVAGATIIDIWGTIVCSVFGIASLYLGINDRKRGLGIGFAVAMAITIVGLWT